MAEYLNSSNETEPNTTTMKELADLAQKIFKKSISWSEKKLENGMLELTCYTSKYSQTAIAATRKEGKHQAASKLLLKLKEEQKSIKDIFITKNDHEDYIKLSNGSKKVKKLSRSKYKDEENNEEEDDIKDSTIKSSPFQNLKIFTTGDTDNNEIKKKNDLNSENMNTIFGFEKLISDFSDSIHISEFKSFPVDILSRAFYEQILSHENKANISFLANFIKGKLSLFQNLGIKEIVPTGSALTDTIREENPCLDLFAVFDSDIKEISKSSLLNALHISICLSLTSDIRSEIKKSSNYPKNWIEFSYSRCFVRIILVKSKSKRLKETREMIRYSNTIRENVNYQKISLFLRLWRFQNQLNEINPLIFEHLIYIFSNGFKDDNEEAIIRSIFSIFLHLKLNTIISSIPELGNELMDLPEEIKYEISSCAFKIIELLSATPVCTNSGE